MRSRCRDQGGLSWSPEGCRERGRDSRSQEGRSFPPSWSLQLMRILLMLLRALENPNPAPLSSWESRSCSLKNLDPAPWSRREALRTSVQSRHSLRLRVLLTGGGGRRQGGGRGGRRPPKLYVAPDVVGNFNWHCLLLTWPQRGTLLMALQKF